jgi:hypothetical protein
MNRIKMALVRFGVRTFSPTLRSAERLETLRTVERTPLPENTRAELRRNFVRLMRDQFRDRTRPLASARCGSSLRHTFDGLREAINGAIHKIVITWRPDRSPGS